LGTFDFGGVTLTSVNGSDDVFAAKLDAALGNLIWVKQLGGPGGEFANRIVVDAAGNVYGGVRACCATLDYDPGAGTAYRPGGAVWKLDSNGNFAWARNFGATSVALDSAGRVITIGGFPGPVADLDVGSNVVTLTMPSNQPYIFVAATEQIIPTTPYLTRLTLQSRSWPWSVASSIPIVRSRGERTTNHGRQKRYATLL